MPRAFAISLSLVLIYAGCVFGQASFEVASVKPSGAPARMETRGGPGTEDPGLFTCLNCPFAFLVNRAYGLDRIRVSGPDWMRTTRFDIAAKIPSETQKLSPAQGDEQLKLMLQNLLSERFKLAAHFERKEMDLYEITVAKNGPKIHQSSDDPKVPASPPPAGSQPRIFTNKLGTGKTTMEDLTHFLATELSAPVVDASGLKGKYDVTLFWIGTGGGRGRLVPPPADPTAPPGAGDRPLPGPDIFEAVRTQLGLELKQKKGPVDILVIDHAEKVPTEN